MKNALRICLSVSFFLLLMLSVLYYVSFDRPFYHDRFERYGVYDSFGKERVDVEFEKVLVYVEGGDSFESSFFSERDKLHLVDVRNLYSVARALILVSLLVFLFILSHFLYRRDYVSALSGVLHGSLAVLVFFIVLSLVAFFSFDAAFITFHKIFFRNDLWLLNPLTDNLINLLPQQVFVDITERLVLYTGGVAGVVGLASLLALRKI